MSTSKQIFSFSQKVNGSRPPVCSWSHDSSYLAVGTERKYVYIVDKRGKVLVEKELPNSGRVEVIDWDNEDEMVAILQEGASSVLLWAPFTGNLLDELQFQNQKMKITWVKWSATHPVLTSGNEKGYLNFYFKKNKRKVPTMGKHSKRVITGDWNNDGLLVTGSEDKLITISNHNSDNAYNSLAVKAEPRDLKWMTMKTEERNKKQTTICGVLNQKTLLIHDITQDKSAPLELMFESKYGKIIDYQFYGDGYILVGFGEGYYCHVSTHEKEMKDEIKSERVFNAPLEAMAVNNPFYKMALAGENKIKIISLGDWKEIKQETIDLPPGSGKVASLNFSPNGNTLIIVTQSGIVYGYILSTAVLISTYNELVAMLSSLSEVVLLSCSSKKKGQLINNINLPFEPSSISLGPNHLAARLGNTVKFYRWLRDKMLISGGEEVNEIQCEYNIKRVEVGDGWAALLDDKNKVHLIEIQAKQTKEKVFPVEGDRQIVQFFLTKMFLIYLDNTSRLKYYHIEDKNVIMEHKPDNPILRIFPNKNGTKIILQHQNGETNLFFPTTESYHHLNLVTDRVDKVIWDNQNMHEFVIINGNTAFSYIISKNNIFGNIVAPVNEILSLEKAEHQQGEPTSTKVEKNVLTLSQGNIFFMSGITVSYLPLTSHAFFANYSFENDNLEGHTRYFFANLSLRRFQQCLIAAKYLRAAPFYDILGKKALQNLQIETSLKSYQMGKNLAMVLTLQPLLHENQRDLLIGHVAMILGKYDLAQEFYLKSSEPLNALDMRCDIQDWFIATSLTKNIAPEQENFINKRLATQTESLGNNTEALKQFQKSVINSQLKSIPKAVVEKHNIECFAGIARTSIKLGDIQRGFNIARDIKDKSLLTDIAVVCENLKQYLQAAQIYEKAQNYEKAATLYLQLKMFKQAAPIMDKVTAKSIQIKYGKAKESQGAFKEAEQAYEKAEAWEDVVRINLSNFDNLQKPKNILRNKCSTSTVASIVANYCEKRGFWKEAVQFSIMANRKEEAFVMAQAHGEMDTYADELKECSVEQRTQIAVYYESKSMWDKAARQYDEAKNPLKALKLYIKAGQIFIDKMLDLIERNSSQEHLIQELLDYLMGETDGQPKDPIFTYNLYRILKNFRNAAKIAVTIASTEQQNGEYKKAHQILVQSYQDIKKANVPIPLQLEKKLSILHSYMIVNGIVSKLDQPVDTALLWNKISKNILQFPKHASNILTKCVYAAMRADLKGLAYSWAIVVFRPEYKNQIPEKAVDKIKKVAMKPVNEQAPDPKSPCPFCKEPLSDYNEDCPRCLNYVPYCIASGKHVVADDLAQCKHCKFYCNYSSMKKALANPDVEKLCPMCETPISLQDITFVGENGVSGLKKAPPPKEQSKKEK